MMWRVGIEAWDHGAQNGAVEGRLLGVRRQDRKRLVFISLCNVSKKGARVKAER